jgi:uncharacterized DUF497 family protein
VFEWDPVKAATNLRKHGVSFEEAATVFLDLDALVAADVKHSAREARFHRIGRSAIGRVLVVVYTARSAEHGEAIRLISARRANAKERAAYAAD